MGHSPSQGKGRRPVAGGVHSSNPVLLVVSPAPGGGRDARRTDSQGNMGLVSRSTHPAVPAFRQGPSRFASARSCTLGAVGVGGFSGGGLARGFPLGGGLARGWSPPSPGEMPPEGAEGEGEGSGGASLRVQPPPLAPAYPAGPISPGGGGEDWRGWESGRRSCTYVECYDGIHGSSRVLGRCGVIQRSVSESSGGNCAGRKWVSGSGDRR